MEESDIPSKKPRLEESNLAASSASTVNGIHDHPDDNDSQTVPSDANEESSDVHCSSPVPGTSQLDTSKEEDEDDDDVSVISGISDMSGKEWKPNMTGKLGWLMRARNRGADPRELVSNLFQDVGMLSQLDDNTIWSILFKMFAEPPRREKLKDFNTLEDIAQHIKQAKNILVLTGAGVSVSCGIPDFRSKDGVYARLAVDFPDLPDPQAMFDIHYFRKDPRPFFKFAKEIYPGQFSPSPCHKFISCLEKSGKLLRNYTQNIDTLEQVAGISQVVQCHGSFATASCTLCRSKLSAEFVRDDILNQKIPLCPTCPSPDLQAILDGLSRVQEETPSENPSDLNSSNPTNGQSGETKDPAEPGSQLQIQSAEGTNGSGESSAGGPSDDPGSKVPLLDKISNVLPPSPFSSVPIMKPDIVFFGEGLSDEFHRKISEDKEKVDLLIVIGSSLKVRPVALIPSSIPEHVPQILINRERLSHLTFDVELLGDCDTVINQLCHMLEGDWSSPIHRPPLVQTQSLPDLNGSLDESKEEPAEDSTELSTAAAEPKQEETESRLAAEPSLPDQKDKQTDEISTKNQDESDDAETKNVASEENSVNKSDSGDQGDVSSDRNDESEDWRPKPISELIPDGHFLFLPPHRYVFTGAEVYADDLSDNELDEDDDLDEEEIEDPPTSSDHLPDGVPDDAEVKDQLQTECEDKAESECTPDENLNRTEPK